MKTNMKALPINRINGAIFGLLIGTATSAYSQSVVTFTNGRLFVDTPNGDQNIKFVVGANAGQTQVFGVPGLADGTSYNGVTAISLVTGTGFDKVEFDVIAAQSLSISSDTAVGMAETKIQWKVAPNTARSVNSLALRSATGDTKAELDFTSEAQDTDFTWTANGVAGNAQIKGGIDFKGTGRRAFGGVGLNLGDGNHLVSVEVENEVRNTTLNIDTGNASETNVKVLSDDPTDFLGLTFNARAPKTVLETISSASVCNVDVTGAHLSSFNEMKYGLSQIRPGKVSAFYDLQTATGGDKIEANISAPGSTVVLDGSVRTGGGDDFALFNSSARSTVVGLDLIGGDGNDFLSIALNGIYQNSQTIGPVISAGNGNDTLILRTDTSINGTGLPNDVEAVINGGEGFDLFSAFGIIISCEQRL